MRHLEAFARETQLIEKYTEDKAFTVWAMGLYLNTSDLQQLAQDYLTDASDDHKIDFLYYDEDEKTLLVVQGYHSGAVKQSAKSTKASDLNAALAWLFDGNITQFNDFMRPKVVEIREAIDKNELQNIELVFAHNCGESKEVDDELKTAASFLTEHFKEKAINVSYKELGNPSLELLFSKKTTNVTIADDIDCPFPVQYQETSAEWSAVGVTINGDWLRNLYLLFNTQLFSANYRGYLGESRNKINKGIKNTAEHKAANFWAYNNGITILTPSFEIKDGKIILHGMSIINGAQTTGSLGQIPASTSLSSTLIMARIIQCADSDVVGEIVKYNNMQNKITSWDSYGNDSLQLELKRELNDLHHEYSIKRGFDSRDSILNIETIIQPLLAFNGKYKDAGRSKSTIFETKSLYDDAFSRTQARHILLVSCLSSVIYSLKEDNKIRVASPNPSATDLRVEKFFQQLRSRYYLMAILSETLTKVYATLTEKHIISLMPEFSDANAHSYTDVVNRLKPCIKQMLTFIVGYGGERDVFEFYNETDCLRSIATHVEQQISALRANEIVDNQFKELGQMLCNG